MIIKNEKDETLYQKVEKKLKKEFCSGLELWTITYFEEIAIPKTKQLRTLRYKS